LSLVPDPGLRVGRRSALLAGSGAFHCLILLFPVIYFKLAVRISTIWVISIIPPELAGPCWLIRNKPGIARGLVPDR